MTIDRSSYLEFLRQPTTRPVWVQAIARWLYLIGYTSVQFYIPLIFVNQLGWSATTVGMALGSGALAGVVGHLLGGYLADAPAYGRKRTLAFAGLLAVAAMLLLTLGQTLLLLLVANVLMGLSAGCYWTAADAAVVDATQVEQRQMAFALLVLADSLGGGLGVWAGGLLLERLPQGSWLFGISALPLLLFLAVLMGMADAAPVSPEQPSPLPGFARALRDRALLLFVLVNMLFTTDIALISSTLPLYLTHTLTPAAGAIASPGNVANLFTWCYIGLGVVLQIPVVQMLGKLPKTRVLGLSMLLWGIGFLLIWLVTVAPAPLVWVVAGLVVLSIAGVIYKPFAAAIVAELAPPALRGVYLAISYQCWSIGYFIGPVAGGWAMDQTAAIAHDTWLVAAATTPVGLVILYNLAQSPLAPSLPPAEAPQPTEVPQVPTEEACFSHRDSI